MAGFPNLFLLVGPNTGLGHSSMVFMIESQVAYVVDAREEDASAPAEVRRSEGRDAQARYNARIQERLKGTVWSTGCMSWYLTRSGKNTTLWPGFTFEYRLRTRRFDLAAYDAGDAVGRRRPRSAARASPTAPAMTTSSRSLTLT